MKQLLVVIALLFGAPALAQTADRATESEIRAYVSLQSRVLQQMNALMPSIVLPESDNDADVIESCRAAAASADKSVPRVHALMAELNAAEKPGSTGNPERDESLRITQAELLRTLAYFESAFVQLSALCKAVEDGDLTQAEDALTLMVDAIIEAQSSITIGVRAAKAEPGPPAKKAAVEGLALTMDGIVVITRIAVDRGEGESDAVRMHDVAAALRTQAAIIRAEYRADPSLTGSGVTPRAAKARLALPDQLDEAAGQFELAAAKVAAGTFADEDETAFLTYMENSGIGAGYNQAWAGR